MPEAARTAIRLRRALFPIACAAGLLGGCSQVSSYSRSRGLDLLDTFPMSIAWGGGVSVSVEGTPCLRAGLGLTPVVSDRFGFEDRRLWGTWNEFEAPFPWVLWLNDITSIPPRPVGADIGRPFGDGPPLMYLWQLDRDAPLGEGHHRGRWEPQIQQWGEHPPYGRESGGGFVIPAYRRRLDWRDLHLQQGDNEGLHALAAPDLSTLWIVSRDGPEEPQAWDLFQVDVFAGCVGLRVGFRPVEGVDFLLGIVGIDLLGDDVYAPQSNLPQARQESGATDS